MPVVPIVRAYTAAAARSHDRRDAIAAPWPTEPGGDPRVPRRDRSVRCARAHRSESQRRVRRSRTYTFGPTGTGARTGLDVFPLRDNRLRGRYRPVPTMLVGGGTAAAAVVTSSRCQSHAAAALVRSNRFASRTMSNNTVSHVSTAAAPAPVGAYR